MKLTNSLCLLLPALIFSVGFSKPDIDDNYKVIKVNGSIQVKKTGKALQQGDIFKSSTTLQFNSAESKATVINGEKGRFVITNQSGTSKGNNLIPAINNIASRGGALLTIIDLQNLFQGNLCVINQMKVKIACADYKMSKDYFFYLQYSYKGEKINKPLSFSDDSLNFSKTELYKVDGKAIDAPDSPEVTLFYRDNIKKTAQTIGTFNLVFPNENDLKAEVKIILDELKTKNASQKTDEVLSYLNEFYGKPDKDNVNPWLSKNFGLK
jgi:hypothetical protein